MLLVSIVGDFSSSLFPLYNELKEDITHHIVVDDDAFSERKKHTQVIDALHKFNHDKKLDITTEAFIIDEDSQASIKKLVERIKEIEPDISQVYINITDGLANIGLLLSIELIEKGAKFLSYDMFENSYNITDKSGMQNKSLTTSLTIKEHFELKGLIVEKKDNKEFAHKYKREILELFNNYAHELELLNRDITQQKLLKTDKYPRAYQLVKTMKLDVVNDAPLITGGLFECYVYLLIKDMPFDDIELGLIVKQPFNDAIQIANEFDILLMKDNHLHMIECKFRRKISKDAKLNLVYKYSALMPLIDDDSQIMILTHDSVYQHDLYDPENKGLNNHRRAFLNRIALRGSIINNKRDFLEEVESLCL